jgi:formylglycine-generating enzyme required for sulfatase activity/energy-coupling factor transporter ATP-binding protein EcfA2
MMGPQGYDVFLSYPTRMHRDVRALADQLRGQGLEVFLDRWNLVPGQPWTEALERALSQCQSVAVCLGPGDLGPWQQREKNFALNRQSKEPGFPVIPVLFPGADPALGFLAQNTWVDFRAGLDDAVALEILCRAVRRQPPGEDLLERIRETFAAINPYKGLAYFREEDAAFFFGRDQAIATLQAKLRDLNFIAVVGASGSGKSSLVRAGLIPQLRQDTQAPWEVLTLVPGDRPFYNLAAGLMPLLEPELGENALLIEIGSQAEALLKGTVQIRDVIERILTKQRGSKRFLLVVDQWEELYTLVQDIPEQKDDRGQVRQEKVESAEIARRFIDQLLAATQAGSLTVVATLRGDFVGKAIAHRPLADRLQDAQVMLGPMSEAELRQAIEKPAEKLQVRFEPGLVDRLLEDVGREPGHLPLLEFVLQRLWTDPERKGKDLRNAAYNAMGKLQGALTQSADAIYDRLKPAEQAQAKRLFLQLVKPGEDAADTRRRARLDELGPQAQNLVAALTQARLLVTDRGSGGETVEVSHEALIRHWGQFGDWLKADRGFLLWRESLKALMDEGGLLRDAHLAKARGYYQERRDDLNSKELRYIETSIAADDAYRRRVRRLFAAAFAVVLAACGWLWVKLDAEWAKRRPIYREDDYVLIPTGSFQMGSAEKQEGDESLDVERPRHYVTLKAFKLSRYELTFEEYDRFAYATGRRPPSDSGFGAGLSPDQQRQQPVINVTWDEAVAYADWLSQQTGKHFRLPSEAEWEYAARAGTETRRYWGDDAEHTEACRYANVLDRPHFDEIKTRGYNVSDPLDCDDPFPFTAPVGQFLPNAWGLHDMLGNVWEWTADCWHGDYQGAPSDRSASQDGKTCDSNQRVVRGGSWINAAAYLRSAARYWYTPDFRFDFLGVRLVQDL